MNKSIKYVSILLLISILTSCVRNLDFDQINDYQATPAFKASIVYFTVNQLDFFDVTNSVEITTPVDQATTFTALKSDAIRNNLERVILDFEINNQFNRDFYVTVEFLNDSGGVTHSFAPFEILGGNANFTQTEEILIKDNTGFLSSTRVRVSVELTPSTSGDVIDPNVTQTLEFKSAGTFYIKTSPL